MSHEHAALRHGAARGRAVRAGPASSPCTRAASRPYDSTHLGHATAYVTYDVLQRRLRDLGHDTQCVRNVTDVDDDILRKARELGVHYLDLAAEEMARFDADMRALDIAARASASRAPPRPSTTSSASSAWCSIAGTRTRPAARCTSA